MKSNGERTELAGGLNIREKLQAVSSACIGCDLCQEECAFLKKYGKPKEIAERYDPFRKEDQGMPFECSLCGLCTVVCPVQVDPAALFLEMRRETVRSGGADFPEHTALRDYERQGASRIFSYYGLPEGCDTVFFPGCTLSGTRSNKVILTYQRLKKSIPSLGIVLDCCTKPSHDLGREDHFRTMFSEMQDYLVRQGVKRVLVACPNCYKVFARYGIGLSTETIYEVLVKDGLGKQSQAVDTVTIHDPCAVRFEEGVHRAVRELVGKEGPEIEEMDHFGPRTLCCGEGGGAGFLAPDLESAWGKLRQEEVRGRKVVTYCAGCANALSKRVPTTHVLDILFDSETASGKAKVARPPFTYWKRLKLKKWFKRNVPVKIARERIFVGKEEQESGAMLRFLLFLVIMAIVTVAIKTTGVSRYLEQQTLRVWIESYGIMAPLIYMAVYTIAPSLFLPGLPITIAGGILFGPFWGVVYTIIGSTLGACVAFQVSRYLAREWVEQKLKGPRWRRLDAGVEKQGWKMVAFTRLIPLFPFNLLNYAFGLTKISFQQYAVTTFFSMLPACIAFIVFSSSLLDLIRGRLTASFMIGVGLVLLVSLFPLLFSRYKEKKMEDDPI